MRVKRWLALVVALGAALPVTEASAAERIQDGSLETATTCSAADCSSTVWSEVGFLAFLCDAGVTGCGPGAAATGTHWVRFGGIFVDFEPPEDSVPSFGFVEQRVPIPAAPATLSFRLTKPEAIGGQITLKVTLDGTAILSPDTASLSAYPYTAMSVDVSQFAGPGNHDLRFEFTCVASCGTLELDDISLDAADPPAPPEPPAVPVTCAGRTATIVGTGAAETLTGTPGNDVIAALGGNDTVKAAGGNDVVCGGDGRDRLLGGRGRDRLLGQTGRDRLGGGRGRGDPCDGGDGKDLAGRSCERVPT